MTTAGDHGRALDLARHRRALALCDEASELPGSARVAFVQAAAGDDHALASLAMALLARVAENERLDGLGAASPALPAAPAARLALPPGEIVGGYRVARLLGEGGMGAVYLAQRDDGGVTRNVALKTMNRLRPQAVEVARFTAEQRALAQLHHPYIATLVDVGVTADGTPWFAMEYVPGQDIARHCDARGLGCAQRIALWAKVCEAVQYAHRNLVVHRDIKPANVLVTDDGLPKLLDFGVAKLLASGGDALTAEFARHLTLDYATPERIVRSSVSTAEDAYALGVLLYELLCGVRPFERAGLTFGDLLRRVEAEHAAAPAHRYMQRAAAEQARIAAARRTSVRQLRAELQGDMAAVLAKALHPDPGRRYGSVEAFAEDVRRVGLGLPVRARGDSAWYRTRRFVGRHRLGLGAATVSASAVLLALVVSIQQTRLATAQAQRATAVSGFLQEVLAAPSARWDTKWRGNPDVGMADVLAMASSNLEHDLHDQPDVRAQLYESLARAYAALGRNADAVAQQRKALDIVLRELPPDSPVVPQTRLNLATVLDYLRTPAGFAEARQQINAALAWHARHAPGPSVTRAALVGELGVQHFARGDQRGAIPWFEQALQEFAAAGGPPDHPQLGVGLGLLGLAYVDTWQLRAARVPLERSVTIAAVQGATSDGLYVLGALAFVNMVDGRHVEAQRYARKALRDAAQVAGPASVVTGMVYLGNALVAREAGDLATAGAMTAQGGAILDGLPGLPADMRAALVLARAEVLLDEGRDAAARTLLAGVPQLRHVRVLRGATYDLQGRWCVAMGRALVRTGEPLAGLALLRQAFVWRAPILGPASPMQRRLGREIAALVAQIRTDAQPRRRQSST